MNYRRLAALLVGVVVLVGLLAGCSAGEPAAPPEGAAPQESTPPAGATEPESAPPADATGDASDPEVSEAEPTSAPSSDTAEPAVGPTTELYTPRTDDGIDVLYFETSNACSCMAAVGDAVEAAVVAGFQDELQSGDLRFYMAISNSPSNIDLVKLLNSQPFDLFVIEYEGGQGVAEPVYELWSLTGDDEAIAALVQDRIRAALERQR